RLRQSVTLTHEGPIRAYCPGLCTGTLRCAPPDTSGGVNATLTGERLTEPKLPGTRDMSYPRVCPVEPPKHIVRVKVPSHGAIKRRACQAPRCDRSPSPNGAPHFPPG